MQRKRVAVIGGGITGAVLAGELIRSGLFDVHLIERTSELGGLHRSVGIDGAWYDAGTILFSTDNRFFQVFPEVLEQFVPVTCKWVSIAPSGKLDGYPMTMSGYIRNHGLLHMVGAFFNILLCKMRYCRPKTAAGYAKYYLGGTIYRHSGLKSYMERLFGLRDDEIHVFFAHRRLGGLAHWCSFRSRMAQIVMRILAPLVRKPTQSGPPPQEVVRPVEGFAVTYSAIAKLLEQRGVNLRFGTNIKSVSPNGHGFMIDADSAGGPEYFDHVVSTIPVPLMAKLLGDPSKVNFEYVPLLSMFYRLRGEMAGDATVLYNFTPDGNWKRITRFSAYYGKIGDEDYFTVEVAVRAGEKLDVDREREAFERQAKELGVCSGEMRYQGHVVTDRAYPIFRYSTYNQSLLEKEKLVSRGIILTGRQGNHDYVSTLEAAQGAWEVARNLIDQTSRSESSNKSPVAAGN